MNLAHSRTSYLSILTLTLTLASAGCVRDGVELAGGAQPAPDAGEAPAPDAGVATCAIVTGDFKPSTPSELAAIFPEGPECYELSGSLRLTGDAFVELSALSRLAAITKADDSFLSGSLLIEDNADLAELAGLERLEKIAGVLYLFNVPSLANVDALANLTEVGVELSVRFAGALTSIEGWRSIAKIGGRGGVSLWLEALPALTAIEMPALVELGGTLQISGNDALRFARFPRLEHIAGGLVVGQAPIVASRNAELRELSLPLLRTLDAAVRLNGNSHLEQIDLRALRSVTALGIVGDQDLHDLSGFASLQHAGSITIDACQSVPDLRGLENLTTLDSLSLLRNGALASIDGVDRLEHLGRADILANDALTDVSALVSIDNVGMLRISRNRSLAPEHAGDVVRTLRRASPGVRDQLVNNGQCAPPAAYAGDVSLEGQADLEWLSGCQRIDGDLKYSPTTFEPANIELGSIREVGGSVTVGPTFRTMSITLSDLERIEGSLILESNFALTSFGVPALVHVGGDLVFRQDPALPACTARAVAQQLSELGGSITAVGLDENAACP